jgi:hypothetical protein
VLSCVHFAWGVLGESGVRAGNGFPATVRRAENVGTPAVGRGGGYDCAGVSDWVGGGVGSLSETFADLESESERVVDSNLRQTVRYTWGKP